MKLAVLGDSFADFSSEDTPHNVEYAWFNRLANKLDATLIRHARRGSSIYNAYKNFLTTYKKCDVVIVIVTNPDRYTKSYMFSDGQERNVGSITFCEYLKKHFTNFNADDRKYLDELAIHMKHDDYDFKFDMSELMLMHMESLHPNVIFYPSFDYSFKPERKKQEQVPDKYCLRNIQIKQFGQLKMETDSFIKEKQPIVGHLVHEYNNALAEVLYSRIKQNKYNFSYFDRVHTIQMRKEYYYAIN